MDVGHIPQSILQKLQKTERTGPGNTKAPASNESVQGNDSVTVSSQAKTRLAVRKSYDDLPNVNQEKINYFRQQIENGDYKPVSREVVVKIFDSFLGQR